MAIHPLQPGPCTMDEAVGLMAALAQACTISGAAPDSPDEAAAVVEGRVRALEETRSLQSAVARKRALIRAVFEGPQSLPALANPFEELVSAPGQTGAEALELEYMVPGTEGAMEAIALYLPRAHYGARYGIYLHAWRILELATRKALDPLVQVVPVVCVHELFHAYVERVMDPAAYILHTDNPCLWEEAAANRAAVEYCESAAQTASTQTSGASATPGTSATPGCATPVHDWTLAREVLAPTRDRGGPPGYGDWPSVARDYPAVVPGALAAGRCAVAVNHPDWTLAVGDILLMNAAERRETLAGLDLWAGMRSRFVQPGERVVPVYVDLVPWKR